MSAEASPSLATSASNPELAASRLFRQVESYEWHTDAEFQSGLAAILGPGASGQTSAQNAELTLRARCFYYARKFNTPVDFTAYAAWRGTKTDHELSPLAPANPAPPITSSEPVTPEKNSRIASTNGTPQGQSEDTVHARGGSGAASSDEPLAEEPAPTSFAEVMELIQSGQPIPGIKQIPDTVLEGQGTQATRNQRRKPWEREPSTQEQQS